MLVLRDTQGIAEGQAVLPPPLIPVVALFDGNHTVREIAALASRELGRDVPKDFVEGLARELDEAFFLETPRFERERERVEQRFRDATVRPAAHAGGAYHGDATKLREYLESECLARAPRQRGASRQGRVRGLVAPHIDPWRGAAGYGRSYAALAAGLTDDVETFVIFGTSHAPMRAPFSVCPKAFDTPFGSVPVDDAACARLANAARFDVHADLMNHKREHSIEFQVVFLKHLLGARPFRIVPILAGLGRQQARRTDPSKDADVEAFLDSVRELVDRTKAVVIAGADMAHVGPRFGDRSPYDAEARDVLERRDRASLASARSDGAREFWEHVVEDLDTRRVCGLAPIYSLLRVLEAVTATSELVHYEQTVDAEDGSIVSHAGVALG